MILKFKNVILPTIIIAILPLFLPFYLIFKILNRIKRKTPSENMAGKVVLITGASSGIGEHLAYEYARRGARLALGARRLDRLKLVAEKARNLGSSDVIIIYTDVSKIEDCKRFIKEAVDHFGQLDHLINNAGIAVTNSGAEDSNYIPDFTSTMDVNFWGSVYCTHYAIPHLRKSKGKIVGIASIAAWLQGPPMVAYCTSKAALINFYETLRIEYGSEVGITIVTPGAIQSEITTPEFLSKFGYQSIPIIPTETFAKTVIDSTCRGDCYLTVPSVAEPLYWIKTLYPEIVNYFASMESQKYKQNLINKNRPSLS